MYDPEGFAKTNKGAVNAVTMALRKHGHLFRWRGDGKDVAVDAGCGPANMLVSVVRPFLRKHCSKIYALDMTEEMVNYCKKTHSSLEDVEFLQVNVENKEDIQKFLANQGPVDHVIASFLLHWFMDEQQGVNNLSAMLKPGGDFLTVHLHSTSSFYMYEHIQKNEKWGPYFDNIMKFAPKSLLENHNEANLQKTLEKSGLTDIFVELERGKVAISHMEEAVMLMKSIHGDINKIPEDRHDEYMRDYMQIGMEKGLFRLQPNGEVEVDFNVYVGYGRKPGIQSTGTDQTRI